MTNPTARKFGYPHSLIAETDHWLVLIRPQQPVFGALVLVCKEDATAFSDLSPAAFADLQVAVRGIERLLSDRVDYARINYLMLMMVDKDVHFHVLPRYDGERLHDGRAFPDHGWPGQPALAPAIELGEAALQRLAKDFAQHWRTV